MTGKKQILISFVTGDEIRDMFYSKIWFNDAESISRFREGIAKELDVAVDTIDWYEVN